MSIKVFIDGEVGTTGLQIRDRLVRREDIELVSLDEAVRKNLDARLGAFEAADFAILCLPDDSVREIVPLVADMDTRLIDASTAHRVDPAWVYGFAEMSTGARDQIAAAKRVSNPGCYSTGAIALIRPLVDAGLIASDQALTINAVSGYTGGGKSMIAEFEAGEAAPFFVYGTDQTHKHLPEIQKYSNLDRRPIFVPSVGNYAQGMIVQVPLNGLDPEQARALHPAFVAHYGGAHFVKVVGADHMGKRIDPRVLNDTNNLEIAVLGDAARGAMVLMARLDNLGKGASGAAVQNLNIMMGIDETTGL